MVTVLHKIYRVVVPEWLVAVVSVYEDIATV